MGVGALFFLLLTTVATIQLPQEQNEEVTDDAPLEVTVRPLTEFSPIVTLDDVYMEIEGEERLTFSEWLRRSFGPRDGHLNQSWSDEVLSGARYRNIPADSSNVFDRSRIEPAKVGTLLGSKFKKKSFLAVAESLNFDPNATKSAWYRQPFQEYKAPVVNNNSPVNFEFGVVDFGNEKWELTNVRKPFP